MDDHEALRDRVGGALTAWMAYARINPTELSRRTGISRETIYAVKDGKRLPDLEKLNRLGLELGTTGGRLLDGAEPPKPNARPGPLESRVSALEAGIIPSRNGESGAARFARVEEQAAEVQGLSADLEAVVEAVEELLAGLDVRHSLRELIAAKRKREQDGPS